MTYPTEIYVIMVTLKHNTSIVYQAYTNEDTAIKTRDSLNKRRGERQYPHYYMGKTQLLLE